MLILKSFSREEIWTTIWLVFCATAERSRGKIVFWTNEYQTKLSANALQGKSIHRRGWVGHCWGLVLARQWLLLISIFCISNGNPDKSIRLRVTLCDTLRRSHGPGAVLTGLLSVCVCARLSASVRETPSLLACSLTMTNCAYCPSASPHSTPSHSGPLQHLRGQAEVLSLHSGETFSSKETNR